MSFRLWIVAAFLAALASPVPAGAASGWPWPVGSSIVLSYGASYVGADGRTCSHGGVDIPAEAGATIRSCAAGTVTFAGLVPAGEGHRAYAVTVAVADGLKVTYLPLERASVKAGASVDAGDRLGSLAESGDASSGCTHLHLGVRRGDRQIDPAGMLATPGQAPVAAPPVSAAPAPVPVTPPVVVAPVAPVAPTVPAVSPATAARPAGVAAPSPLTASATAPHAVGDAVSAPAAASAPMAAAGAAAAALSRQALASPRMQALRDAYAPTEVRLDRIAQDVGKVRDGIATAIERILMAGAAALLLRPVVRALRRQPGVAVAEVAPRSRA